MTNISEKEAIQKYVGERIKKRREELGYSQTKVAELTGVTPAAISQFESGTKLPSIQVLTKLANALRVTTEYLLGKKEDLDIEDVLQDESVRTLFRDFKGLHPEDKELISRVIKSLKSEREKKEQ